MPSASNTDTALSSQPFNEDSRSDQRQPERAESEVERGRTHDRWEEGSRVWSHELADELEELTVAFGQADVDRDVVADVGSTA